MWDICLFSYFSKDHFIPSFTRRYVLELKKFFKEVIFMSSDCDMEQESIDFLSNNNITLKHVTNKGHDFGMYKQCLPLLEGCETMAFANDSVILINDFDIVFNTINEKN